MALTKEGYKKRTPGEIKEALINDLKEINASFLEQPADIQNNLLDSSVVPLLQFENVAAEILNGFGPEYANDFIWLNLANSLNLTKKSRVKAQVELKFMGVPGTYIPVGTSVSVFTTESSVVLGSTGEAFVLATTEENIFAEPNTLTEIDEFIDENLSVTNPNASIVETPAEDIAELRNRARIILRSARKGSYDYAIARLNGIKGVNARLLKFRELDYNIKETGPDGETVLRNVQGIEAIVGGGDPYEVAGVLKDSFLETKKLISEPSNGEESRSVNINIKYFRNTIPVAFTRPKNLDLSIKIGIQLKNNILTQTSAEGLLMEPFENYINSLELGESINKLTFDKLILDELIKHDIQPRDIIGFNYKILMGENILNWNGENFLDEVKWDCYLTLGGLGVEIVSSEGKLSTNNNEENVSNGAQDD